MARMILEPPAPAQATQVVAGNGSAVCDLGLVATAEGPGPAHHEVDGLVAAWARST